MHGHRGDHTALPWRFIENESRKRIYCWETGNVWIAGKGGLWEDRGAGTPRQGQLLKLISWTACEPVLSWVSWQLCFAAASDSYKSRDPPHNLNAQHHCATPSKAPSMEAAATIFPHARNCPPVAWRLGRKHSGVHA